MQSLILILSILNADPKALTPVEIERQIAALESQVRSNADEKIRAKALQNLANFAHDQSLPCPRCLIEAMADPVDLVRYTAASYLATFKKYAPGAEPALLRGFKSTNWEVRSNSVLALGIVAVKDPKWIDALRGMTKDPHHDVRHSASIALYRMTDRIAELLPYFARLRTESHDAPEPSPNDSEELKLIRIHRNLVAIGSTKQIFDWLDSRTDETSKVLLAMLNNEAATTRRSAAIFIEEHVHLTRLFPRAMPDDDNSMSPQERAAKLLLALTKVGVIARLEAMAKNDPSEPVRSAATSTITALKRMPKD